MNLRHRLPRLQSLWLIVAVLVLLLAGLYRLSSGIGDTQRLRVETGIHEMTALDAAYNLDILKLRNRQLLNYDGLVATDRRMDQLFTGLTPEFARLQLSHVLAPVRDAWQSKVDAVERFKRLNAVLTNSQNHFINLATEVENRQHASHSLQGERLLDEVSRSMLIFITRGDAEDIPALSDLLDQVSDLVRHWDGDDRAKGELLVSHGRKILDTHLEVQQIIDQLVNSSFTEIASLAYITYNTEHAKAAQAANNYRAAMAGFALLLIITVATILVKLRDTAENLAKSHRLLDNVASNLGEGILAFDADGRINFLNQRAIRLIGRSQEELIGHSADELFEDTADTPATGGFCACQQQGQPFTGDSWLVQASGERLPVALLGGPMPTTTDGSGGGYVTSFRDISDIRQAEARLHLAARVFDNLTEAMTITGPDGRIQSVNPAFAAITGYNEAEAIGHTPGQLLSSGLHAPDYYRAMWKALSETGKWSGEIINRRKNGETYPEWLSIAAVRDPRGHITHYVGLFTDLTERKEAEAYIHHLAYHDPLTGLANRLLFQDRLNTALLQARRTQRPLAVMMLDLDRFKSINDSLGHGAGDQLLKEIAQRLTHCLREGDTLARLGGDEFAVLMPEIHSHADAATCARKLLSQFDNAVALETHEVFASTSIGIAVFPGDGSDASTLIKHADHALYAAKDAGRSAFRFFVAGESQDSLARLELESALRHALPENALRLFYQLQIDSRTGLVAGAEALIRWQHPTLGLLSPNHFVPLAESTGLIDAIGTWVLETGCRQMVAWRQQGIPIPRVAINVSARQLRQPNFVADLLDIIARTGVNPSDLEIELTESMLSEDTERTFAIFSSLRQHGVRVALDDFGTGYSSLSYLARYPVDTVKIDQSFVRGLEHDPEARSIVQAIILLAHGLAMTTIAEGVETLGQKYRLKELGCDELQGYLFARPLPSSDLPAVIAATTDING